MLTIRIQDKASDELRKMAATLPSPRAFFAVWAQRVTLEARQRARAKGGRRFWTEVERATKVDSVSDSGAVIGNWHVAGGHKQTGGPIVPTEKQALTIPVAPEARGKRAAEFEMGGRKLFLLKRDGKAPLLGYSDAGEFHALFILLRRVMQKADPWFPGDEEIGAIGFDEGLRMLHQGGIR